MTSFDPDGRTAVLVNQPAHAIWTMRRMVPAEDRKFIRPTRSGNRMIVDPEPLNSHKSPSGNFQRLATIAMSSTIVEVNTQATTARDVLNGQVTDIPLGKDSGITGYTGPKFDSDGNTLMEGGQTVVSLNVAKGQSLTEAAITMADETVHASRMVTGQPSQHEFGEQGGYDPKGAVNREAIAAMEEAERNAQTP